VLEPFEKIDNRMTAMPTSYLDDNSNSANELIVLKQYLRDTVLQHQAEKEDAERKIRTLRARTELQTEYAELLQDMQDLIADHDELNTKHNTLRTDYGRLQAERDVLKKKLDSIHSELEACQMEMLDPQEVQLAVLHIKDKMKRKLRNAEAERKCMQEKITQLQEDRDMVDAELTELERDKKELFNLLTEEKNRREIGDAALKSLHQCRCRNNYHSRRKRTDNHLAADPSSVSHNHRSRAATMDMGVGSSVAKKRPHKMHVPLSTEITRTHVGLALAPSRPSFDGMEHDSSDRQNEGLNSSVASASNKRMHIWGSLKEQLRIGRAQRANSDEEEGDQDSFVSSARSLPPLSATRNPFAKESALKSFVTLANKQKGTEQRQGKKEAHQSEIQQRETEIGLCWPPAQPQEGAHLPSLSKETKRCGNVSPEPVDFIETSIQEKGHARFTSNDSLEVFNEAKDMRQNSAKDYNRLLLSFRSFDCDESDNGET
jgi:hypothetical protein